MEDKTKFDVYEYNGDGLSCFFSRGVSREFGENKVVFVDGMQLIASVQPLHSSKGLDLIGYLYA